MVQDGKYVYNLAPTGFTTSDLDVLLVLLEDAIECGQNGCNNTHEPPSGLMNSFEEQREIWLNE